MKILLLPVLLYNFSFSSYHSTDLSSVFNDTSRITHVLDGNTLEWSKEKFESDRESKIQYACDNNDKTLFLAIKIADKEMLRKVLNNGMIVYIDAKGKKKENKGIEFPLKMDNNSMSHMKLFGFTNLEPFVQPITIEGTVNIASAWDSLNVLNIEYHIPTAMLGNSEELKNKKINIGWAWKEGEEAIIDNKTANTTSNSGYTTTTLVARPAGTGPARSSTANRPITPGPSKVSDPTLPSVKTQSVWTAYTIIF